MLRETYNQYLQSFNGQDYDKVLAFWTPEFVVYMGAEILFDSPESLKRTYAFLHSYTKEEILVDKFLSDDDNLFMEARVRITAKKEMTQAHIDEAGVRGIMPIAAGQAFEIPQFVHYTLENDKFKKGTCLVSGQVIAV